MDIWVLGHLFKLLYGNKLRMVKNMEIINYYIMKVVNRNGRDVGLRKMVLMCKKQVEIRRSKNKQMNVLLQTIQSYKEIMESLREQIQDKNNKIMAFTRDSYTTDERQKIIIQQYLATNIHLEEDIIKYKNMIAEQQQLLEEKQEIIEQKQQKIQQREELILQKERIIYEKEHLLYEKQQLISEKQLIISKQQKERQEKEEGWQRERQVLRQRKIQNIKQDQQVIRQFEDSYESLDSENDKGKIQEKKVLRNDQLRINELQQEIQLLKSKNISLNIQKQRLKMKASTNTVSRNKIDKFTNTEQVFMKKDESEIESSQIMGEPSLQQIIKEDNAQNISFSTVRQLINKIDNFDADKSIVSKINKSKFFTNPQTKLSFVIQYACILEMYFCKEFLSIIREQLLMSEHITMHKISEYDLNKMLFTHNTADTSILNESSSSKLHISNQYHINSFSQPNKTERELSEIEKYIQHDKRSDIEKIVSELKKLQENETARLILRLIEENESMKKCINEMLQTQGMIAQTNNNKYFEKEFVKDSKSEKDCIIF